jgi:uncharacterized protein YaeQ
MALPSTLYHFDLHLSHVERGIDEALVLKAARHPSETLERVWLRVLALLWQWEERIQFGPGLCEPDAADVVAARLDGTPSLVVRVGKPEPIRVARDVAQNGGARIAVLFESPRRMEAFLAEAAEARLARIGQVELAAVDPKLVAELCTRDERRIRASVTLVADHFYIERDGATVEGPLLRTTFSG